MKELTKKLLNEMKFVNITTNELIMKFIKLIIQLLTQFYF